MQTKTTRLFTLPTLTPLFMETTQNVCQMMNCIPKNAVFCKLTNHLKNQGNRFNVLYVVVCALSVF